MRHPFRRKNARLRLLPGYLLALALFAVAAPSPGSLAVGALLVAAGLGLRAWGAGHLVKTARLSVAGPYAHLRHPLYAGALLAGVGLGVAAGAPGLGLLAVSGLPAFFLYYLPYKERVESARLERHYGAVYRRYRAEVPALLPRRGAWCPPPELAARAGEPWSRARFHANHEGGTVVGVLAGLALLAMRPWLWP